MNHLINVYKHKCEQLQEQLNNLLILLNEAPPVRVPRVTRVPKPGTWVNAVTSMGRAVQRNIKDVEGIFRNLHPDQWLQMYSRLNITEQGYFRILYGQVGGIMNVIFDGSNVQVRLFREAVTGRSGIYFWNTSTNSWTRFPTGYQVPGIGANGNAGIYYSKEWLNGLGRDVRIEMAPNSTETFSPASPHDFHGRGEIGDTSIGGLGGGNQSGGISP